MPRPTRIEYEGAFHHVMNRGRAHRNKGQASFDVKFNSNVMCKKDKSIK